MENRTPIYLFVFEGIDGAGKSTLLDSVGDMLEKLVSIGDPDNPVMEIERYRLPCQDVPMGADIRGAIKNQQLTTPQEILGLTMNRSQLADKWRRDIVDAGRARSVIVLMDRWGATCDAYQGTDAPHLVAEIARLHKQFVGLDAMETFYVDIDPQEALSRMCATRSYLDPNEQDIVRQASIRSMYQHLAKQRRWVTLKGEYPTERLTLQVVERIYEILGLHAADIGEPDHE